MALVSEALAVALFRVESLRIGSADFGNHRVWYSRNKSDKKALDLSSLVHGCDKLRALLQLGSERIQAR